MSNLPNKVLVVDTDRSVLTRLETELEKHNIKVIGAADLSTAMYQINSQKFDVVVVDIDFDPVGGLTVIQKFRSVDKLGRNNTAAILPVGGALKPDQMGLMGELPLVFTVEKPIQTIKLLPLLSRALGDKISADSIEELKIHSFKVLEKTGDLKKAINSIDNSETGSLDDKNRVKLDIYEEAEDFEKAIQIANGFIKQNSNDVGMLSRKATLTLKGGSPEAAREAFEVANEKAPKNLARLEEMAKLYLELREPEKSIEKMKQLVELNPDLEDLQFKFFDDLENAGFQENAVQFCHDLKTPPKEIVKYYNNKGVANKKAGFLEEALNNYYSAIMFYPKYKDNFRVLYNIAIAEANKKTLESYEKAHDAIKKCMELKPDFNKAQNVLEIIEKNMGKLSKKAS